ncbi:hypothetical protein Dsin_026930 [Dipteronia sinensis]|uniref:TF-B3 domain-containing protein n=1 Tax=Dipteronia sinensis TaxID=43782 RepID=A0AAD9ZYK2_9ROSI|nr:hypothetical protein Dsin_026930 [Dipteronia sinensis]
MKSNSLSDTCSHFFKIILPDTLQHKELGIPEKFVRKFGDELRSAATLTVPNGRAWQVGLRKDGETICFSDGWHDFVECHSISSGYFLLFKYIKNSNFHVLIFEKTACEINYPDNGQEPENEDFDMRSKACETENLVKENNGPRQGKLNCDEVLHCKRRRLDINDEDELELFSVLEDMRIIMSKRYRNLAAEEKRRLISAARLFKPTNPSFIILLRTSSMCYRLYMPLEFTDKYLHRNDASIKLKVSDSREWSVQLSRNRARGWIYTQRGWNAFSKDMDLQPGDVCVFELIRMKDPLMKVSIFAASSKRVHLSG